MLRFRYHRLFAAIAGLAIFSCVCRNAHAGACRVPAPSYPAAFGIPILLKQVDTRSFMDALRSVASQAKIAFVVEGIPYHHPGTMSLAQDLKGLTAFDDMALGPLVDEIGSVYGYFIEDCDDRTRTITLRKTYDDVWDLPDVTPDELQHSMHEILRITSALNPAKPLFFDRDSLLAPRLRHDWDTPQFAAVRLRTGQPIEDFSPDWQERFHVFVLQCYIEQPMRALQRCQTSLNHALRDGPDQYQKEALAEEKEDDHGILLKLNRYDAARNPRLDHEAAGVTTLGTLTDTLNQQPSAHGFAVEDSLREKHLLVVGSKYAAPEALFRAAAAVYGLRCLRPAEDSPLGITSPYLPVVRDPAEISKAFREIIPAPLMRIHDREFDQYGDAIQVENDLWEEDERQAIFEPDAPGVADWVKQTEGMDVETATPPTCLTTTEWQMKTVALRRLRFLLAPDNAKNASSWNTRTGVSNVSGVSLSAEERQLLAISVSMDALSVLGDLIENEPPTYVTDFEHDCVCGKIASEHDEKKLAFFVYNLGKKRFSRTNEYRTSLAP